MGRGSCGNRFPLKPLKVSVYCICTFRKQHIETHSVFGNVEIALLLAIQTNFVVLYFATAGLCQAHYFSHCRETVLRPLQYR